MDKEAEERLRVERALYELCLEQRYLEVELPVLLDRAGIDKQTFRRHFADLDACFCSFYLELRDELMRRVCEAFLRESGWRHQIRGAAWTIADYIREDPGRARIAFVEVWFAGERAKLLREEAMRELFHLIDQGRRERGDDRLSPLTAEFVGSSVYLRLQVLIERGEIEKLETEVPELLYVVVLPYLGHEVAEEELRMPPPERH
jgi:AcrR family transcriptional regulator